jgi:hypothetical protein
MNLEDPTPAPPADPITPPAEPVVPTDPDEAQAIEVQGGKMVPLAALKAAREEAKQGKEAIGRVQQLEQELAQARPYQQFVQANPGVLAPAQAPAPPVSPDADPELVELARSLDYIKVDGSPDLERAAKHQKIIQKQAEKIAQRMVEPVALGHAQQMSNTNWSVIVQQKMPNGQPVDAKILGEFWQHMPVDKTADPRVAAMIRDLAYTEQMRRNPLPNTPPPPNAPPIHTENLGRGPAPATRMTPTERGVAAQRGMTDEKYGKLTSDFTPGRMNPLED